ncbi:response regulator [Brevibacillus humidisoli]|uniref:response regulator n=1 Tax=Brevibacillus humidisoli TaxID=2895522 RepID=UPI003B97C014
MISIVIIEDDPMVLEVNRQFAQRLPGFQVIGEASNGLDGLSLIRSLLPRLVLLDIFLPDMDGIQVLKQIRQEELPTDVVMLTAARDAERIQDGFRYGVIDYLIKPFRFERFQEALEKVKLQQMRMGAAEVFNQDELDHLRGSGSVLAEAGMALPKGLNEVTLQQITAYLRERARAESAEEVAEGTGLARVTVRRYLEYLVRSGEVELQVQYGSVGRPMNRYRWR